MIVELLPAIGSVAVVLFCMEFVKNRLQEKNGKIKDHSIESRDLLFSQAEHSLLNFIDHILGDAYRVFGKVRLCDVLQISESVPEKERRRMLGRFAERQLGFIICNRNDLSIVGAIELEDKGHKMFANRKQDVFAEQALSAAGIPFLQLSANIDYSLHELKETITQSFCLPADSKNSVKVVNFSDKKPITHSLKQAVEATLG